MGTPALLNPGREGGAEERGGSGAPGVAKRRWKRQASAGTPSLRPPRATGGFGR